MERKRSANGICPAFCQAYGYACNGFRCLAEAVEDGWRRGPVARPSSLSDGDRSGGDGAVQGSEMATDPRATESRTKTARDSTLSSGLVVNRQAPSLSVLPGR